MDIGRKSVGLLASEFGFSRLGWLSTHQCVMLGNEAFALIEAVLARDAAQRAALLALRPAQAKQPESLYEIPFGCICMGDGLMGMRCEAKTHAILKQAKAKKGRAK